MNKQLPLVSRWTSFKNIFRIVKNPIPVLNEYTEVKGDTFLMFMGGTRKSIFTVDPELVQYVLQKNNRNYRKSEIQTQQIGQFAGKGLLTTNGSYWLRQRRLIQPGFHRAKLEAITATMLQVVKEAFAEFDELATKKVTFDIAEEMTKLAFRMVAKSLFTTSVSEKELMMLSDNIQEIQEFIVRSLRQPYLKWWFKLSGWERKQFRQAKESREIILKVIKERRESGETHEDLLDMLLEARYEDTNEGMTDQQLLDESLILFVAGHETSANALAWTFYLLCENPEAVEKIKNEYQEIVGNRELQFSDFPKLTFTTQVIQEAMRLYPPAWITDRLANESDEFKGTKIPKDFMVAPYIYGLHHSKKLWDEPEKFKPERFTKENMKAKPAFA